jgi:L-lysine exporter family protein LysE/ArgO
VALTTAPAAVLSGLVLGLSLIVAIGAQNAFVLRQGLRREHVGVVVALCAVSDAVLILLGVGGAGLVLQRVPALVTAVRIGGALFLLGYGALAARRALRPSRLDAGAGPAATSLAAAVTTCLALTWLNPHVYLDTVVLLGAVATTHGGERWWFAAGAATGSVLWFTALGYGARWLRPLFARPTAWRVLDAVIAVVMVAIAVGLVLGA